MQKRKKRCIVKTSIFIISLFIIFFSVTYAFINQSLAGTKRQVITSGNLSLELLEDENNLIIQDAMPMYDEVGMLQDAFTFRLVNKVDADANYILKLEKIIVEQPLDSTIVKYGLTKDEETRIDFISNIVDNTIDTGVIRGNQTIHYSLRLWIDSNVEEASAISSKSLRYRLNVEASQNSEETPLVPATKTSELISDSTELGENCKTYNDGVDTFLVGQCQNNYVWYSGKLWKAVLKNNETGFVKVVTDKDMTVIPYSQKYSTAFENSYVDQWLNQEFLPTLHDYQNYLVVNSVWDATEDDSSAPVRPNQTTAINRTVGLLNYYEYYTTYGHSDGLATKSTGYLNHYTEWWLLTPKTVNGKLWLGYPSDNSFFNTDSPEERDSVRPSVNLKSDIKILTGDGTISNPYKLEGEQEVVNGATLLNTRYSGEYVNFNGQLYRIVDMENSLTKITAVAPPAELSTIPFHTSEDLMNSFTSASIKGTLENYYQNLNSAYKSMVATNTTWYLGVVDNAINYKTAICATVDVNTSMKNCVKTSSKTTANIGLPRAGEMFTSQIAREKRYRLWTLTPNSSTASYPFVQVINPGGYLNGSSSSDTENARPSMYLKSTVRIASTNTGDGTYEHPYDIELGI